jgi:hypothetical protein
MREPTEWQKRQEQYRKPALASDAGRARHRPHL